MIEEFIRNTVFRLEQQDVPEARLLAEHAVAHVTGIQRLRLVENRDRDLSQEEEDKLHAIRMRLAKHEPLQYVLGETEFMGRRFLTDRRALIPRPETEELVQRVLNEQSLWDLPKPHIIDVGTGTGCIAITLLLEHPNASLAATDVSPGALDLAWDNEDLHRLDSVKWMMASLLNMHPEASADAIVSNPPYIPTGQLAKLERHIREYEPLQALDGGEDGLQIIIDLIEQGTEVLKPGGWFFLEIGDEQGTAVRKLFAENGYIDIEINKDLAGRDRIAVGRWPCA